LARRGFRTPLDELTIADLKRRKLHLEDEIDGFIRKVR